LVIPARLRRVYALDAGSEVILEETPQGIMVRPALTIPLERYAPDRRADLLAGTAVDDEDRRIATAAAGRVGLRVAPLGHDPEPSHG